jgi:hypothetical protein
MIHKAILMNQLIIMTALLDTAKSPDIIANLKHQIELTKITLVNLEN